jgi:phosphatidate phosphatase
MCDFQNSKNRPIYERVVQIIVDLAVIIILFIVFALVYALFDPKISYFTCNDSNEISYPYKPDTVEIWVVGVYGVIAPCLFIILVELKNSKIFIKYSDPRSKKLKIYFIYVFHALSLFALGIALTLLITEIGKRFVGRLRPHFLAVCTPDYTTIVCTRATQTGNVYNSIFTGGSFCTGDAKKVKEARLSFPSGHSSFSCYCMLFLIIYLEARMHLLKLRFIKPLIQGAAFIAAYITCVSRISDYHHRYSDVIVGACIGIAIAFFITLVIGRVLWVYNKCNRKYDWNLHECREKKTGI